MKYTSQNLTHFIPDRGAIPIDIALPFPLQLPLLFFKVGTAQLRISKYCQYEHICRVAAVINSFNRSN
jgi:hypothetical protein